MNADDSRIERNVDFLIVIVGFRLMVLWGRGARVIEEIEKIEKIEKIEEIEEIEKNEQRIITTNI